MGSHESSGIEIGATLRETRKRLGLDIRTIEEQTKIRIKYLRALEAEEWEVLPAPAYVRGFLRSYADAVGLDGELLVDEYRYRVLDESSSYPVGEKVLLERRRLTSAQPPRPNRLGLVAAAAGVAVVVLLLLALLGGGGGEEETAAPPEPAPASSRDRLKISAKSTVEGLCVSSEDGIALLAGTLSEGRTRRLEGEGLYLITIARGRARIVADGGAETVRVREPASFEAGAAGVNEIDYLGAGCP